MEPVRTEIPGRDISDLGLTKNEIELVCKI